MHTYSESYAYAEAPCNIDPTPKLCERSKSVKTHKDPRDFSHSNNPRNEALSEYYFLEDLLDRYDEKSLKIKSWSVTSSAVAIGVGFTESKPILFALAVAGSIVFWYLDALWGTYQSFYARRAAVIEEMLTAKSMDYPGPGIVNAFRSGLRAKLHIRKIPNMMFSRRVLWPHCIIILFGMAFSFGSFWLRP